MASEPSFGEDTFLAVPMAVQPSGSAADPPSGLTVVDENGVTKSATRLIIPGDFNVAGSPAQDFGAGDIGLAATSAFTNGGASKTYTNGYVQGGTSGVGTDAHYPDNPSTALMLGFPNAGQDGIHFTAPVDVTGYPARGTWHAVGSYNYPNNRGFPRSGNYMYPIVGNKGTCARFAINCTGGATGTFFMDAPPLTGETFSFTWMYHYVAR